MATAGKLQDVTLRVIHDNIPEELRERSQWVLWRLEQRGKDKPTKLPYQVRRRGKANKAAANKPDTWTNYLSAMTTYIAGGFSGVGYVFAANDPYCGIDLDLCRDSQSGAIEPWAQTIIDQCGSYAEVSPSATGVKIFLRGRLPSKQGKRHELGDGRRVELYDRGRYFAVTGHALAGTPATIADGQAAIDDLWQRYFAHRTKAQANSEGPPAQRQNGHAGDAVERCRKYVAKMPPAISGQGGHNQTFNVACETFRFGLADADAAAVLAKYNQRCQPPWDESELQHKLDNARERVTADGEFGCRLCEQQVSRKRRQHPGGANGTTALKQLPEIELGNDEMRVADETIAALGQRDDLYQRGGLLVEIRESPEPPPCIVRPDGGIRAGALSKWRLRELITDTAIFKKARITDDGEQWVEAALPMTTVEQVLARGQWRGIPPLEGIVTSPQFLLDGSILIQHGYDRRSGLYFADGERFGPISDAPAKADGERARDELLEVVADVPIDDVSRAAWVAIVLTGAARHAIDGPTPLFAIDANVRGSGKSLAADSAGIIHTGRQLPRTSAAGNDDEFRKRITATLLAGEPLVLLDNINGVLGCASLDALLTSTTWTDRILGESAMTPTLPAKAIWIATGNNLQFAADTARRTLRIRLQSLEEKPEERTGFRHPNLLAWVRAERGRLASAAVVILRAWHVAGRPDMKLPPWGSFDNWSAIVRNAVVWIGLPDPGTTRQEVQKESDREAMLLRQMLLAWRDADPNGHGLTVAEAIKRGTEGDVGLAAVFAELADKSGKVSPRGVGMKLHHLRGRVCGGLCFDSKDTRQGAAWLAKRVGCGTSGTSGTKSDSPTRKAEKPNSARNTHTCPGGAASSPASGASGASGAPCDHLNSSTWLVRDGKAHCAGCGKFMGNVLATAGRTPA